MTVTTAPQVAPDVVRRAPADRVMRRILRLPTDAPRGLSRREFCAAAAGALAACVFAPRLSADEDAPGIVGHGDFRYRLDTAWGTQDKARFGAGRNRRAAWFMSAPALRRAFGKGPPGLSLSAATFRRVPPEQGW